MTTKITIEVPLESKYQVEVIYKNVGQFLDGTIEEHYEVDTVLPGQNFQTHIWKGRSINISEKLII